jgi:hypothetical protein
MQKRRARVLERYNRSQEPTLTSCVTANEDLQEKRQRDGKIPLRPSRQSVDEKKPEISQVRKRATQDIWTNRIQKELTRIHWESNVSEWLRQLL